MSFPTESLASFLCRVHLAIISNKQWEPEMHGSPSIRPKANFPKAPSVTSHRSVHFSSNSLSSNIVLRSTIDSWRYINILYVCMYVCMYTNKPTITAVCNSFYGKFQMTFLTGSSICEVLVCNNLPECVTDWLTVTHKLTTLCSDLVSHTVNHNTVCLKKPDHCD